MNNITAIIPARSGSTRFKDKNIAPFNGTNLLINKIRQLNKASCVDRIVVSSDSELYLQMALSESANVHRRDPEYADEKTRSFGEVVSNICSNVEGEYILWATCTCPLLDENDYDTAIKVFFENYKKYKSLVSFYKIKRYLWTNNGPLNYKLGLQHVLSQQLPDLYIPTFGICIAKRTDMIKWNYFHDSNPFKFFIDKRKSVDIDDELDYKQALSWEK